MPAVTFFSLLNEGYRLEYADHRLAAQIALVPYLEQSSRRQFLSELDQAASDFSDILSPSGQGSPDEALKQMLGGGA